MSSGHLPARASLEVRLDAALRIADPKHRPRANRSGSMRSWVALGILCVVSDACSSDESTSPTCERNWKFIQTSVEVELQDVWGSPGNLWAVGQNGVILHCDDSSCSVEEHDLANSLLRITGNSYTDIYAAGWAQASASDPGVETRGITMTVSTGIDRIQGFPVKS
jgi:hypothetical protein